MSLLLISVKYDFRVKGVKDFYKLDFFSVLSTLFFFFSFGFGSFVIDHVYTLDGRG